METVKASIGHEKYKTTLTTATNSLIADEPEELGGTDAGFSPVELLAGALASCTAITLRMYAERKAFDTGTIDVTVTVEQTDSSNTHFHRKITLEKQPEEALLKRMLAIANACPTHKLLSGNITIHTTI